MYCKFLFIPLLFITTSLFAQVKIGDNHDTIHPDAILELESTDKGILLPRVALSSTDNQSPFSEIKTGMMIYNTASAGSGSTAVSPGLYISNGSSWQKTAVANSLVPGAPIGSVMSMAANVAPSGYLVCDGAAISRTTYSDLFAVIGTTYGTGDGSTTFNLPDYRGYFLRGFDDGAGNNPDAQTRIGGNNVGSIQNDEITSPIHGSPTHHNYTSVNGNASFTSGTKGLHNGTASGVVQILTTPTGGNETRPVNMAVRYYIKF